jgi:putative Ca2+/H+ antiporter (TMEM165/GDT1 family)
MINHRRILILSACLAFVFVQTPFALAATSAGSTCTKAGQTQVINSQKFTCSLIWVKTGASLPSKSSSQTPAKKKYLAQSKSFALVSVSFSNDSLGDGQATARIQNTSGQSYSAFFTITVFKSDGVTPSVTLNGAANSVSPGETQTVQFLTGDGPMPSGKFSYAFQTTTQI